MRAIDLYSGVGGWSLGLALAGIEVVASYERFEPANETNRRNNRHQVIPADIRTLDLESLPTEIDLVVGSPPCTQFSYSNRGGGGDLVDGLKDIARFLKIVDYLRPKFWVMENVPRVAAILKTEMSEGGALAEFAHLNAGIKIVNMADWGLPQRRRRSIVGNINFDLLQAYAANTEQRTLGDVVRALQQPAVLDPIYGTTIDLRNVTDHVPEEPLNEEEVRVNSSAKTSHPVYNAMPFPDPLDRSVRTITATCTRVSRESIVISPPENNGAFRRLTLRERACLQGFPLNFQFHGASHGMKGKMIGNAVPPLFSFYVGQACLEIAAEAVRRPADTIGVFVGSDQPAAETKVETAGHRYPKDRTFRFSLPGFNFKSGVRFELSNQTKGVSAGWAVGFYFGHSTSIQSLTLDAETARAVLEALPASIQAALTRRAEELREFVSASDVRRMQDVWTRRRPGGTRPFDFLDELGRIGATMLADVGELSVESAAEALESVLVAQFGDAATKLPGRAKLARLAPSILIGAFLGSVVNECIAPSPRPLTKGERRVARA